MTTFAELKTIVSRDIRDPAGSTFDPTTVGDMINAALTEVGRVAPKRFQEDISLVANTLSYQLQAAGVDVPVTGVAATDVFTAVAHSLLANMAIRFTALVGGAGLAVGTTYYVLSSGLTADAFKVAASVGGTAINFTTDVTAGSTYKKVGSDAAIPEIEVTRVELWDSTTTPIRFLVRLQPGAPEYENSSATGWRVWGGVLHLTNAQEDFIDPNVHLLRVWGYTPYLPLVSDGDLVGVSNELEQAMRVYCGVEKLMRLVNDRDLFAQWQTRTNNSDVSPASLINDLSLAEERWRRKSRAILVLREAS